MQNLARETLIDNQETGMEKVMNIVLFCKVREQLCQY